jgi:hypothetical protein
MESIPKNFVILILILWYSLCVGEGALPLPPSPCLGFNCKTTLKLCGPYWKWRKLLSRAREPMRTRQRMQKEGRALPRLRASGTKLRTHKVCSQRESERPYRKGSPSGKLPKQYHLMTCMVTWGLWQSDELTIEGPWVSSALSFIGEFTSAQERCIHVLNLIWFGNIARQWGGGG